MTPYEEKRAAAIYTAATMLQGQAASGSQLLSLAERVLGFIEGR